MGSAWETIEVGKGRVKMHATAAAMEAEPPANTKRVAHGNVRLKTLDHLDGRTLAARRANELAEAFEAELGVVSGTQRLAVRRAAMLTAIAEDLAARQLAGEAIDLDQLIRASNAARRAVLDLGIKPGKRERKPGAALAAHLARNHAAEPST